MRGDEAAAPDPEGSGTKHHPHAWASLLKLPDDVLHQVGPGSTGDAGQTLPSRCQSPNSMRSRRNLSLCDRSPSPRPRRNEDDWWSQTGSNRRPHACKARALPTELWPLITRGRPQLGAVIDLSSRPPEGHTMDKVWWAQADSNCRPHAYQACALTN